MKIKLLVLLAFSLIIPGTTQARRLTASSSCSSNGMLNMTASAPLLSSGVLTQLNMAALFATTGKPTSNLVTIVVTNNDPVSRTFRLLFELKAIPSDSRIRESCNDPLPTEGGQGCWIQRAITAEITLKSGESWIRTSSQLESDLYQPNDIEPDNSPFQRMLIREGFIPPGAIYLNVGLLCPREKGTGWEAMTATPTALLNVYTGVSEPLHHFVASYQPTKPPVLVSPGAPATEEFQQLSTSTPTFIFSGNLDGVNLGGESAYRLSVWEVRESESLGEALDRRPVFITKVSHSPVVWSSDWPPLESGKRYAWRVDGLLKGLSTDWLPSTPFGFRSPDELGTIRGSGSAISDGPQLGATMGVSVPSPNTDPPRPTPEQLEILQALSLIIGPYRPVLEQLIRTSLPDPTGLRIGSGPATRTDFQNLVRDILEGRAVVIGAETRP